MLLMQTSPPQEPSLEQNLDLVLYIIDLKNRLDACNADKAALRDWQTRLKK